MSVESRHIGAILGLTAFVVAIVSGMAVDNPLEVTLSRALASLVVGFLIGVLLGAALAHVVEAHIAKYKLQNPVPVSASPKHGTAEPEMVMVVDEGKKV